MPLFNLMPWLHANQLLKIILDYNYGHHYQKLAGYALLTLSRWRTEEPTSPVLLALCFVTVTNGLVLLSSISAGCKYNSEEETGSQAGFKQLSIGGLEDSSLLCGYLAEVYFLLPVCLLAISTVLRLGAKSESNLTLTKSRDTPLYLL